MGFFGADICRLPYRATTTYLVTRRIDMLPKPLTEDICSLRSNVDRLAFSVIWEMTSDIEPVDIKFTKSVIRCPLATLPPFSIHCFPGFGLMPPIKEQRALFWLCF